MAMVSDATAEEDSFARRRGARLRRVQRTAQRPARLLGGWLEQEGQMEEEEEAPPAVSARLLVRMLALCRYDWHCFLAIRWALLRRMKAAAPSAMPEREGQPPVDVSEAATSCPTGTNAARSARANALKADSS